MRNQSTFEQDFEDEDLDSDLGDDYEPDGDFRDESEDEDDSEADDELSGLEGEELNMVEEGVSGELLTSEQAMEVAGIRRAELSINPDDHAIRQNEFLCESCFLVKRITQKSSPRSKICIDCR
ncbi:MAG: hypothetical protein OXM62_01655 [bacterium]|nr:hypothetical protein [bacterium]MDE0189367.1 hypothetical protein [bacterium]MDE0233694.1 hypothetical protein [bacterium]